MAGDFEIGAITEAEVEEVTRFLRRTFHVPDDWTSFRSDVVRWKSLAPHPLWQGSRGYMVRRKNEIVAHGCVMPTRYVYAGGESLVACIIDWAASKTAPGAGVAIYQHIAKSTDGLIGVGGSDEAQRVLPRMGFKSRQELLTFTQVKRPVARFVGTSGKSWRDVARLGRNVWRGLRPVGVRTEGWAARRVERFDDEMAAVFPRPGLVSETACYRDAEVLNYFLQCPAAQMEGYVLEHDGELVGYFVRAFVRGECRIAELWVASASEEDWGAGCTVAGRVSGVSQVTLACGAQAVCRGAQLAGFHLSARQPVYVKEPKGRLPQALDAAMSMLDTDAFYL